MALGVPGTGPYGRLRVLRDSVRNDREFLASGVPGPKRRKGLERSIAREREEIRKILAGLERAKARKR